MKILMTFAVDAEFAPWRKRNEFLRKQSLRGFYAAEVNDLEVYVLLTGMGWDGANSTFAIAEALKEKPDICISSGLAGALKPDYRHGKVLVARSICRPGEEQVVTASASMVSSAAENGAKVVEAFVTTDKIVRTAEEKNKLASSGEAVEMESYHILRAATNAGVPCVAIRAVSDTSEEDLPVDFGQVVDRAGHVRWPSMLREVGRHPGRVGALIRFGGRSKSAATRLADFLDIYVDSFSGSSLPPAMEAAGAAR
jgi:nucleoside phosphorylase